MKRQQFSVAAGIDVHRDTVVVTVRKYRSDGEDGLETRTFETFRDTLEQMSQWLVNEQVEAVGLESTGVYWMPVVRVLQERASALQVLLINPSDIKRRAGRKTDVKDSQKISELVMYGNVCPSYLATYEQSELRRLTRCRTKLVADQTRYKNRVIKQLEASGVKLASVLSDSLGVSGRAMIEALLDGKTADETAQLARGVARRNIALFKRALNGAFTPATAFVLRQQLKLLDTVEHHLQAIDSEIQRLAKSLTDERALLCTAPGIDEVAAAAVLAETGADVSVFPTAKHCTAWAGICPGSEQSAGKSKQAPARKGNKYLRTILVQCSWAAVRATDSPYQAPFRKLCPRLGPKKAIMAIARKMLTAIFYMLRDRKPFQPPSAVPPPDHVRERLLRRHLKALQNLGFQIDVTRPLAGVS
jgi:transposase